MTRLLRRWTCPVCECLTFRRSLHIAWHFAIGDVPEDSGSSVYGWGG